MATTKPTTQGGTVRSWAWIDVKPSPVTIVGAKKVKEPCWATLAIWGKLLAILKDDRPDWDDYTYAK